LAKKQATVHVALITRGAMSKESFLEASEKSLSQQNDLATLEESSIKSRILPSLRNGGIVVFFHNPKTGGTSIRDMVKKDPSVHFVTRQKSPKEKIYSYMDDWTSRSSNIIHFLEIHGESPGFVELLPKLHEWKQQAAINNVPLFVFTMMRDPLDWLLSCFNFFCLAIRKHTKCTSPPTIEGLLQQAKPNPQSRWYCFMNTIMAVPNQTEVNMSLCALQDLLPLLIQYMDWIGFMEEYEETLQVLRHVLPSNVTTTFRTRNKTRRKQLKREMLNENTTHYLQSIMSQDYDLYRGLQEAFRIEHVELPNQDEGEIGLAQ